MKIFYTLSALWILNAGASYGSERWIIEPAGRYEFGLDIPNLGGLSAIEIFDAGKSFVTISDKGKYFQGDILRTLHGSIQAIEINKNAQLLNSSGNNLSGRNTDSESLTKVINKGFYVSFESNHRVMFHKSLTTEGIILPRHEDFKKFKPNKGLEAIAANSEQEIFAIPEEPPNDSLDFPIYKLANQQWSIFARFPRSGSFLVTDATFLPDNDLLILERDYDWGAGFKMQLRILHIGNNTITGQTKLLSLNSGLYNHEGLSLWQDESKSFFLTTVSDNNFLPFIATEIREFRLKKKQSK